MRPGNPKIAIAGTEFAKETRNASKAKIEGAKARIKERVLRAENHGVKLTIAAVLEEAGLNRLYLEGKNRTADKQELKGWLASARDRFKPPAAEAPPSQKLEDRFEVLKGDFIKLQNAYYAAHLRHVDELADAQEEIRKLRDANAELRRTVEAISIGS